MDNKATPWWVVPGLAWTILVIFAGALAASCVIGDTTMRTTMMTGALQLAGVAAGYYLGSSASSQKKDETIAAGQAALATSSPSPVVTTTTTEAGDAKATTTTEPVKL